MPQPNITGWIEHARLLIDAIASGRIEARTLADMTDEQIEQFQTKLRSEFVDEIEEGKRLHE